MNLNPAQISAWLLLLIFAGTLVLGGYMTLTQSMAWIWMIYGSFLGLACGVIIMVLGSRVS